MIDLSRCEDFDLGGVTIRPSSRELVRAGRSEILEPKVMQVLVALAQPPARVVSRDELIERCWNARIVGEDAINRVIGKLRRAAEGVAAGAFRIDTVARVGYRLSVGPLATDNPAPAATGPTTVAAGVSTPRRRFWAALGATLALLAVAGVMVLWLFAEEPAGQRHPGERANPTESPVPPAARDLETRGLAAMFENTPEQTAEGVAYLRQATALAPRTAPLWGSLAMSYVLSLGWAPPGEREAVALRVRDAAAHGLAIDPRESRSTAALVSLEPTFGHWQRKDDALRAAKLLVRQDEGPLLYQEAQFQMTVGRSREALALIERLAKVSPLVPWIQAARVDLLAGNGRLDDADRVAREAFAIWPRDRLTWFTSFDLAAFNGQPERALAMASDRANWPKNTQPDEIVLAQRTVRAMMSHDRGEADQVLLAFRSIAPRGQADAERAMRAAAALGRPAEALAFARQLYGGRLPADPRSTMLPRIGLDGDEERPTVALFLPPMQKVWEEPGFLALMSSIGLIDYWQRTLPPDFCLPPSMITRCRTASLAAGKVITSGP